MKSESFHIDDIAYDAIIIDNVVTYLIRAGRMVYNEFVSRRIERLIGQR